MKKAFEVDSIVSGSGVVKFAWQRRAGNYLAISGTNGIVNLFDRHGDHKVEASITLPGTCTSLDWDKDGDLLTVANDKTGFLFLWDSHTFEITKFDTGMKEYLSLCLWSKQGRILAVGTGRGNLLLYNHRTRRKIPILGKHTKKITCGNWSSQNLLALASEDKTVTISNAEGDTLKQTTLRAEPHDLQFSQMKLDTKSTEETTVSVVVGRKTLYLYDMDNSDNPVELAFQTRYGNIVTYKWYGDGFIMIGFSNGYFVVISTHKNEIGQELFQSRNHKNFLSDVAISSSLNQAASCGDNSIKIHDLGELKEVYTIVNVEEEKGTLNSLAWTDDGQLLAVSTLNGIVCTFIAQLPMIGDANGFRIAYLTSLLEVTIINNVDEEPPLRMNLIVEPHIIALGPNHVATAMNDRVWVYEVGTSGIMYEKSYLGTVTDLMLNSSYAAALFDSKIHLHLVDPSADINESVPESSEGRMFPDQGSDDVILCMNLTADFLVYGTKEGKVVLFVLEDWQFVNEYRHGVAISRIFPDGGGSKLILLDDKGDGIMYNPVTDQTIDIPELPPGVKSILWENIPTDKHIFIASDESQAYTYAFFSNTISGPIVNKIGATKLPFGQVPLLLYNGELSCQTLTAKLSLVRLGTHVFNDEQGMSEEELKSSLKKCISLKRLKDAWTFAAALDNTDSWIQLAKAAMHHLEISTAIRAYQHIKNVAMVYALNRIKDIEDQHLLIGQIWLLMESYEQAQEHFLASSNPVQALEMQRDLLNWNQALNLAKALSPDQVPYISREYANQLEFVGDYTNALMYYEGGMTNEDPEQNSACNSGIARMAIRTGDIRRGISIAQATNNKVLLKECADILDSLKLYAEAGSLYEKCQSWDKAATAYTKLKSWDMVGKLLKYVTSSKIHQQFAKAREADKKYVEAAEAYEAARDYENAIRIYLNFLKKPDDAVRIVKEYNSITGAQMVARFFEKINDISSALNFLVISKCQEEAYSIAQSHGCMEEYATIIGDAASPQDYLKIAQYFEGKGDYFMSGKFYYSAKEYVKAVQHFIQCPLKDDGENIDMAIEIIGVAQDETLTRQLRNYLMGEVDGISKDAKFLFRFYMSLQKYREAAKTAVLISKEEQNNGNYRTAHDVLFKMRSELVSQNIDVPLEMAQNLMLLHSYLLVKSHVRLGNHLTAARLLIRVSKNISKFPSHIVPILTSTVIECQRAGLRGSAYNFAAILLRPEYRQDVDPKYKKKIEQIVRKPDKSELDEPLEDCPKCKYPLPETTLDCPQCKTFLPFCIISGKHIARTGTTECPVCKFPASYKEFVNFLTSSGANAQCPMCSNSVEASDLQETIIHV